MFDKLTDSQKRLIIVVIAVVFVVLVVRLCMMTLGEMTEELKAENETLQEQIRADEELVARESFFVQMTQELNRGTAQVIAKYGPDNNTPEKTLMFLVSLSNYAYMVINSVSFGEEENVTVDQDGNELQEASSESDPASGAAADASAAAGEGSRYYLYRYPVTFSFTTTYQGLKQAVGYVNNYGERMTIDSLSVAFDESSGLLEGTMVLNLYTLTDSIKPHYTVPQITGIPIGNPSIFGTYQ